MAKKISAAADCGDAPSSVQGIHLQHPVAATFSKFAQRTAAWTGHSTAFLIAFSVIIVWLVSGPFFNYSDSWQLVINTGTTIVTFLMVFLIQNTQNRDMLSMQLKLSELVFALKGAENRFASIEDLSDAELEALHNECRSRTQEILEHLEKHKKPAKKSVAAATQSPRKTSKA